MVGLTDCNVGDFRDPGSSADMVLEIGKLVTWGGLGGVASSGCVGNKAVGWFDVGTR